MSMKFGCLNRVSETRNTWRVTSTSTYCPPPSAIPTSNLGCNSLRILKKTAGIRRRSSPTSPHSSSVKPPSSKLVETIARKTNSSSNIENVGESYQRSLLMSSRHSSRTFAFLSWENICVRNNNFRDGEKFKILRRLRQPAK